MAIVYSYIRFSTKKQLQGDSLRRQLSRSDQWIESNGHTPASLTLQDLGVSAYKGKNKHTGALSRFLEAIKEKKIQPGSILLVENLDRLSREGIDAALELWRQILRSGVEIVTLTPTEQHYTRDSLNDLTGMLLPMISFNLASLESQKKSERLASRMANKRKLANENPTHLMDSHKPCWLDLVNGRFQPNPEKVKAVEFIFEKTIEGIGQNQLTRILQEQVKPIARSGKWNGSLIQKILSNRAVLGERQPYTLHDRDKKTPVGKPIKNYYPQIISQETFDQAALVRANRTKQKGPNKEYINLFTGLIFSALDKQPMHLQTTRQKESGTIQRRLVSYGKIRHLPGSDPLTAPIKTVERAILGILQNLEHEDLRRNGTPTKLHHLWLHHALAIKRVEELEALVNDPEAKVDLPSTLQSIAELKGEAERLEWEAKTLEAASSDKVPVEDLRKLASRVHDEPDDRESRLRLRTAIPEIVESIQILTLPSRSRRIEVFGQVTFRSNYYRQFYFKTSHDQGKISIDYPKFQLVHDLREYEEGYLTPSEPEKEPLIIPVETTPETVGAAADTFLAILRSTVRPESFKGIPAKIKLFSDFIGPGTSVKTLGPAHWNLWVRNIRLLISTGERSFLTSRVLYHQTRNFVRWLQEQGLVGEIPEINLSGEKALKRK